MKKRKVINNHLKNTTGSKEMRRILTIATTVSLLLLTSHVFAEGTDLLQGTDGDLISTVKGTGKVYLYIAELITASITFIGTRSPKAFLGVLILSVGFNVLLKIAGI
jgi:hypothetical protein